MSDTALTHCRLMVATPIYEGAQGTYVRAALDLALRAQAMGVSHVIITDDLDNHGTEIVKEEEDDDAACVSNV